jgi:hypothetical protein
MDADDRRKEIAHKRSPIEAHTTRRRVLEQQVAQFGPYTPPHISIELDEVISAIAKVEREIAALEGRAGQAVTAVPATQRGGVALDLSHQQRKWDRSAAFAAQPEWQFRIVDQGIIQYEGANRKCATTC